jgi:hypothetical protein
MTGAEFFYGICFWLIAFSLGFISGLNVGKYSKAKLESNVVDDLEKKKD